MLFRRSLWWDSQASSSGPPANTPPTGSINDPLNGATITGDYMFVVSIADADGLSDIDLIRIYVDGAFFRGASPTGDADVSIIVSSAELADGAHTFYAEITDFSLNIGYTTTLTINTSNSVFIPDAFNGSFTASPLTGVVPLSVVFTASISGSVAQILWDTDGDGNFDASATVANYLFSGAGTFSPKMRLVNSLGSIVDITNTNYLTYTALTTGTGDVSWRSWRTR